MFISEYFFYLKYPLSKSAWQYVLRNQSVIENVPDTFYDPNARPQLEVVWAFGCQKLSLSPWAAQFSSHHLRSSCGLTPASNQTPQSHSHQWDQGENWKDKNWILGGGYKDSLIGKAKAAYKIKAKQGINFLFPMGRQVFSTSRRAGPLPLEE